MPLTEKHNVMTNKDNVFTEKRNKKVQFRLTGKMYS